MDRQDMIMHKHLLQFALSRAQSPKRVFLCINDIAKLERASNQQASILLKVDLTLSDNHNALKMGPFSMI